MGGGSMGGGGGGGGGGGRGSGKVRDGSTGPLSRQGVKDLCGAMGAAVDRLVASLRPLVVPDATLRAGIKVDLVDAAMPALEAFDVRHAAVTSTFKHRAKHVKYTAPDVAALLSGLFGQGSGASSQNDDLDAARAARKKEDESREWTVNAVAVAQAGGGGGGSSGSGAAGGGGGGLPSSSRARQSVAL